MNWFVSYKDGQVISSLDSGWNNLPRTKNVEYLGVYDLNEKLHTFYGDTFFFSDIGETSERDGLHKWLARMIGVFKGDEGQLTTFFVEGSVTTENIKLSDYQKLYKPICFLENQ
jgi:hypothetical protein